MSRFANSYDADYQTTEAMIRHGRRFVSGLGHLYRQGDVVNQAKLKAAFPEYFAKYLEVAKQRERSKA